MLGAAKGLEGIPSPLLDTLVEKDHCEKLLGKLPLLKEGRSEL